MSDPIFDPLRKKLDRDLRRWLVGHQITCPRTGEVLDIRHAVFVMDPDGAPHMAMSQRGWSQVVAEGSVPELAKHGFRADLATIKDADLRAASDPTPHPEPDPGDQLSLFGEE